MAKSETTVKYLIIGNSAGSTGAAEAIREVDRHGTIAIVTDESYPGYSRPMISEYLAGQCSLERMLFRSANFYEQNNIRTFFGRKAERLDPAEKTVTLEGGEKITWEKLLLATGGAPIVPPMEGGDREGVSTFTTLDDAKVIDRYLTGDDRAVVVGGGLIGVSVTNALVKRGVAVTVVEMKDWILNVILDEAAAAMVAERIGREGVKLVTGHTVASINGEGKTISSVTLDDGSEIQCELVVIAIGVRPRVDLAVESGIKVNRGIVVDRQMRTSMKDIYACGDAAEAYDFIYDECRPTPIWPNAYLGGRVAGMNMAGRATEYPGGTAMNALKYFGLDVVSAGMVNPPDDNYETLSNRNNGSYHKVVVKGGVVVGMIFAGNIEKSGIVYNLMKNRTDAGGFKEALVAEDFSLTSLPEELWRPQLAIPATAVIATSAPQETEEEVAGE
ncbi:NAD(P)/FAD-dependent oxidoreductase [Chloroflexota bacterium]